MSDTPRTDAFIEERVGLGNETFIYAPALADFARQLERELAVATLGLELLRKHRHEAEQALVAMEHMRLAYEEGK